MPFYPEWTVPTNTPFPYGTYTLTRGDFLAETLDAIRIWSRSASIQQLAGLLDSVDKAIPPGGVIINLPEDKGALQLRRGAPWIQRQPTDEADLQIGYCNIIVENYIL